MVASQLTRHFDLHQLHEPYQSAYRSNHSTETALVKVQDDILRLVDSENVVFLALLDLSAAFDTVDHSILLHRLHHRFGLSDTVYRWIQSYLSLRSQCVQINGSQSSDSMLHWGVPQGSVLGPLLFTTYIYPIGEIIRRHNLSYHLYADDCQVYTFCHPSSSDSSIHSLELCIEEISTWMYHNKLKLNNEKTEFITFGRPASLAKLENISLNIGQSTIFPSDVVRNLGVNMDKELNYQYYISLKARSCFNHLREIRHIRPCLTKKATQALVYAEVTSRLDFSNSLLLGIPKFSINRLQQVQNCAARLIMGTRKFDHISPVLKELHWLPIHLRLQFKVLVLVYRALHGMMPVYISDMLHPASHSRSLRSSERFLLKIPRSRLVSAGDRAFSCAAPALWNSLPENIKSADSILAFKRLLKTFFFSTHFV